MTRCLKLLSFFYSLLALGGCAIVVFGIWSQVNRKGLEVLEMVDDSTLNTILSGGAPTLIAMGVIFVFMGIVGCWGTLKEKSWMVLLFFIVVLIVFILQFIISVFLLLPDSVKEKSFSSFGPKFIHSLQTTYEENTGNIWDGTMSKLKCCGYKGYEDFTDSKFVKEKNFYPRQCCDTDSMNMKCTKAEAEKKNVRGCIHAILEENTPISGALCFLIAVIEIVALFVSMKIYLHLKGLPDLLSLSN